LAKIKWDRNSGQRIVTRKELVPDYNYEEEGPKVYRGKTTLQKLD